MIISISPGRGITIAKDMCKTYVCFGLSKSIVERIMPEKPARHDMDEKNGIEYLEYDDISGASFGFENDKLTMIEIENSNSASLYVGGQVIAEREAGLVEQFASIGVHLVGEKKKIADDYFLEAENKHLTLFLGVKTLKLHSVSMSVLVKNGKIMWP